MGTISNLFNSVPGTKKDWKEDWKEDVKQDWKFDWDNTRGGVMPAPMNTVLPVISGSTVVGSMLTASTGTWVGEGITYTFQWAVDGVDVSGATASTFDTDGLSIGDVVTVKVAGVNGGGQHAPVASVGVTLT